jgi:hypothetical protein
MWGSVSDGIFQGAACIVRDSISLPLPVQRCQEEELIFDISEEIAGQFDLCEQAGHEVSVERICCVSRKLGDAGGQTAL